MRRDSAADGGGGAAPATAFAVPLPRKAGEEN